MGEPAKYRKKPVVIEAMQWQGTRASMDEIFDWVVDRNGQDHPPMTAGRDPDPFFRIETPEGDMCASKGDWIVRGVKGEFYPCKPDIFAATYELVT